MDQTKQNAPVSDDAAGPVHEATPGATPKPAGKTFRSRVFSLFSSNKTKNATEDPKKVEKRRQQLIDETANSFLVAREQNEKELLAQKKEAEKTEKARQKAIKDEANSILAARKEQEKIYVAERNKMIKDTEKVVKDRYRLEKAERRQAKEQEKAKAKADAKKAEEFAERYRQNRAAAGIPVGGSNKKPSFIRNLFGSTVNTVKNLFTGKTETDDAGPSNTDYMHDQPAVIPVHFAPPVLASPGPMRRSPRLAQRKGKPYTVLGEPISPNTLSTISEGSGSNESEVEEARGGGASPVSLRVTTDSDIMRTSPAANTQVNLTVSPVVPSSSSTSSDSLHSNATQLSCQMANQSSSSSSSSSSDSLHSNATQVPRRRRRRPTDRAFRAPRKVLPPKTTSLVRTRSLATKAANWRTDAIEELGLDEEPPRCPTWREKKFEGMFLKEAEQTILNYFKNVRAKDADHFDLNCLISIDKQIIKHELDVLEWYCEADVDTHRDLDRVLQLNRRLTTLNRFLDQTEHENANSAMEIYFDFKRFHHKFAKFSPYLEMDQ